MKILKLILPRLITPAVIFAVVCLAALGQQALPAAAKPDHQKTVIIDAGHGGFDGGAVASDGTNEKDINLNIARRVSCALRFCGYEVIMTRTDDVGTESDSEKSIAARKKSDLKNRLELTRQHPDAIFVSIHLNKFTTSAANGAQVFYAPKAEGSMLLAESIQASITSLLQPENKRVIKQGSKATYLLYHSAIPSVITECGFLSNSAELKKLKDEGYQAKLAFCITAGINEYFGQISSEDSV